jgi:tyrosinase
MTSNTRNRREFLTGSAAALAAMALPVSSQAAPLKTRMEWQQFKTTTHYSAFLNALQVMQANTNANSKNSWQYWVNVHVNYCPHGIPYFLAWHRGYIYYFEQQLRTISGDANLTLPYWDYYANPNIPAEFLDSSSGNPLYSSRVNTNVYNALSLDPFQPSVINFQTGLPNNFELTFESAPHDPVHDLIGGYMADMTSPMDPIFYLHHSMVDRMWYAWVLSHPKRMPVSSNKYWNGSFTYASGLTMTKTKTIDPTGLGYTYANTSMPTALPPQSRSDQVHIVRVQASTQSQTTLTARPKAVSLATTPADSKPTDGVQSLGGVSNLTIGNDPVSVKLTLPSTGQKTVQNIVGTHVQTANLLAMQSTPSVATPASSTTPTDVNVVLDKLTLSKLGAKAGYYYKLYLNLPTTGVSPEDLPNYFLGTLGAFQIRGAMHHKMAMLTYPANDVLARTGTSGSTDMVVTFVRISGKQPLTGKLLGVGEVRVEVATPDASDD